MKSNEIINNRYKLQKKIGSGSFGEVFLALDKLKERQVALKILHKDQSAEINLKLFQEEFKTLAGYKHPNLVSVYDFGFVGSRAFFTSEFIDGQDLLLATEELTCDEIVDYTVQILRSLEYIHSRGVVHKDIKPTNILVTSENGTPVVKLLDFGLARRLKSGPEKFVSGTPAYMAPEVLKGFSDARSDLYSLGVLLYKITTRKNLDKSSKVNPQILNPQIPDFLSQIILRLLKKNPNERFSRANYVVRAINRHVQKPYELETAATKEGYLFSPGFVEREGELQKMLGVYRGMNKSDISCIFVSGEFGVGKNALLKEFTREVQLEGGSCISGKSFEEITRVVAAREGKVSPYEKIAKSKEGLLEGLFNFFQECSNSAPLVLIISEFQNVDTIDAEILNYLVCGLSKSYEKVSILPVISYHPFKVSSELRDKILSIQGEVPHLVIKLKNLNHKELAQYLSSVLGLDKISNEFVMRVHKLTGGNPAFVHELMREVLYKIDSEIELEKSLAKIDLEEFGAIKSSEDIVAKVEETFDPLSLKILGVLSAMPVPISFSLLLEILSEQEGTVLERLVHLEKREFINQEISTGEIILDFVNDLQKDTIYRHLPEEEKNTIHLKAAELLEKKYIKPDSSKVLELAHHYLRSSDKQKIALYGPLAGDILMERYSSEEALYYFSESLDCLKKRGERVGILKKIVRLKTLTGKFDEAISTLEILLKHASKKDQAQLLIQVGLIYQKKGDLKAAEKKYKKALAQQCSSVEHPHLISLLARIALQRGDLVLARELCDRELSKKRSKKDAKIAPLWDTLGLLALREGSLSEANECYLNSLEICSDADSKVGMAHTLNNLGIIASQQGNDQEALRCYEQSYSLTKKIGDVQLETTVISNLGTIYQKTGQYKEALAAYKEALSLSFRMGNKMEELGTLANLANLYILFGASNEAENYLERFQKKAAISGRKYYIGYGEWIRGDLFLLNGAVEEALQAYERGFKIFSEIGSRKEELLARLDMVDVDIRQGRLKKACKDLESLSLNENDVDSSELRIRKDILLVKLEMLSPSGKGEWIELHLENIINYLSCDSFHECLLEAYLLSGQSDKADKFVEITLNNIPEEYREDYLSTVKEKRSSLNIDKKKKGLNNMDKNKQGFQKLLEINRRMNSEKNLASLLEFIMDSSIELTGARRGFLILRDNIPAKGLKWSDIEIARNFDSKSAGDEALEISSSIAREVLKKGKPIVTDDAVKDKRFNQYESVLNMKLNSILAVPLRKEGETIGILYLDNRVDSHIFTEADIELVESFADLSVVALENAKYFEKIETSHKKVMRESRVLKKELESQRVEIASTRKELEKTKEVLGFKFSYDNIIGQSAQMQEIFRTLDRITDTNIPVLICGESGTGKELIAKALHYNGSRRSNHFVGENCTAIPENLLESELFGHVKGAFTGADKNKEGLFQYADGGTLFLDEIGDMPLALQSKLLRVLQEEKVRPVGGREETSIDVRIVSASHRDLRTLVKEKRFREDLFWRINGITISLPPLRERKEDIPLLVDYYLTACADEAGKDKPHLNKEFLDLLMCYMWPGNIRELAYTVRNAFLFSSGELRGETLKAIKPELNQNVAPSMYKAHAEEVMLPPGSFQNEKTRIVQALEMCDYNKVEAAKMLGVSRKTIYNKMKKYGIKIKKVH